MIQDIAYIRLEYVFIETVFHILVWKEFYKKDERYEREEKGHQRDLQYIVQHKEEDGFTVFLLTPGCYISVAVLEGPVPPETDE